MTVEGSSTEIDAIAPVKLGSINCDTECAPLDPFIKLTIADAASSEVQLSLPF